MRMAGHPHFGQGGGSLGRSRVAEPSPIERFGHPMAEKINKIIK
jgi:hypothetical protein